jgi:hypothetical protein
LVADADEVMFPYTKLVTHTTLEYTQVLIGTLKSLLALARSMYLSGSLFFRGKAIQVKNQVRLSSKLLYLPLNNAMSFVHRA